MTEWLAKIRRRWMEGPDWVRLPELVVSGRYRSPTLLFCFWAYAWYVRVLTIPGRMLLMISPLVLGYTLLSVRTPIRILAFAIIALFVTDVIVGLVFMPRLAVRRSIPERARAGSGVRIEYVVRNRRRLPAMDIELDVHFRDKKLEFDGNPGAFGILPGRTERRVSAVVKAGRRGVYPLPAAIGGSRFPLGLWRWSCRDGIGCKLHVYPAFDSLNALTLPVGRRFQREGGTKVSKVGESPDFAGCRDFRSGDDPRHIHWAGLARSGRLVVKEYQEEYLSRVAVIVDTFVKFKLPHFRLAKVLKPEFPNLEAAVSLAAALADFLARGDYVIDFFAAGPEIYHFQGGRSLSCLDNILDILACIEPETSHSLTELSPLVMDELRGIGGVVLILLDWNEERRKFVDNLRGTGTGLKVVLIEGSGRFELEPPPDCLRLPAADVLGGKVRSL